MPGERGEGKTTTLTGADWQRILRIMDEAYQQHLTGMVALRERVVADLRRKLSDSKVLDRPDLEQPSAPARPASRHRRARGRRPRG